MVASYKFKPFIIKFEYPSYLHRGHCNSDAIYNQFTTAYNLKGCGACGWARHESLIQKAGALSRRPMDVSDALKTCLLQNLEGKSLKFCYSSQLYAKILQNQFLTKKNL